MKFILICIKDVTKYLLNQGAFWGLFLLVLLTRKSKPPKGNAKPKLTWFGAYGNTNIGDDLIYFSLKQFVPQDVEINLSCRQVKPTTNYGVKTFYKGENVFDYPRYKSEIKDATHVILGGGGLFEYYKFTWPARRVIMNYLAPLMLAIIHKKPFGIVGMGVNEGVIANAPFKYAFKTILNRASFIVTRDEKSVNGLHNNGVSGNIAWTFDPVFSLTSFLKPPVPTPEKEVKKIGLLLWPFFLWPNFYKNNLNANSTQLRQHETFVQEIKTYIATLKQKGFELVFPLFHFSDKIILDELGCTYDDTISIENYFSILKDCDVVVSMRYHGQITSLTNGIPIISIPVQEKMFELSSNFDLKAFEIKPDEFTAEKGIAVTDNLVQNYTEVRNEIIKKSRASKEAVESLYTDKFNTFFS